MIGADQAPRDALALPTPQEETLINTGVSRI